MNKHILMGLSLFGLMCVARCATQLPEASVTIKAIDDEGKRVEAANVMVGFSIPYNAWGAEPKKYTESHEGLTDKDGLFVAHDGCKGDLAYIAKKEGYYDFGPVRYDYTGLNALKTHWSPEKPELIVVMKKIINPVPMYVRKVSLALPAMNKSIGFDLELGAWVAPYGKGTHSDMVIYATKQWAGYYENFYSKVTINYEGELDGIQVVIKNNNSDSLLQTSQVAPENNYNSKLVYERNRHKSSGALGEENDTKNIVGYIFRVRSQVDENGRLKSANYGKIMGEIRTGGEAGETMWVEFTYYYNPDPQSRSLEFDSKQNLAKDEKYAFPP